MDKDKLIDNLHYEELPDHHQDPLIEFLHRTIQGSCRSYLCDPHQLDCPINGATSVCWNVRTAPDPITIIPVSF